MYILNFGTWDIASSLIDYSFVVVDDGKATYFANPDIRTAPDLTCAILATIISIENWSRQEPYGKCHHNVLSYFVVMPLTSLRSLSSSLPDYFCRTRIQ
jgi:hypothetical protein